MFLKGAGLDLGTANIVIHLKGKGIVVNEPAVMALDRRTKEPAAIGTKAYEMIGRAPEHVEIVYPIKRGVIADYELAEVMVRHFFQQGLGRGLFVKPRVIASRPFDLTSVGQNILKQVIQFAGAKEAVLQIESELAAIGAGIDIFQPSGNMIIDLGAGRTDAAVLSMGEVVSFGSSQIAGRVFDESIIEHIKKEYDVYIGMRTAEQIKMKVGLGGSGSKNIAAHGRNLATGLTSTIEVTPQEVEKALRGPIQHMVESIRKVLEQTPPELSADITARGIILTGGGALMHGIDHFLAEALNVPVAAAENPMNCVINGTAALLERPEKRPVH